MVPYIYVHIYHRRRNRGGRGGPWPPTLNIRGASNIFGPTTFTKCIKFIFHLRNNKHVTEITAVSECNFRSLSPAQCTDFTRHRTSQRFFVDFSCARVCDGD